jgi:hypothetical protein
MEQVYNGGKRSLVNARLMPSQQREIIVRKVIIMLEFLRGLIRDKPYMWGCGVL